MEANNNEKVDAVCQQIQSINDAFPSLLKLYFQKLNNLESTASEAVSLLLERTY